MNLPLKSISKVLFVCMFLLAVSSYAVALDNKININTANVPQLTQLKRIGTSYATRIVAYREHNGNFTRPEDIMKVKGIGKKTFEINQNIIIVSDNAEPAN